MLVFSILCDIGELPMSSSLIIEPHPTKHGDLIIVIRSLDVAQFRHTQQ